MSNELSTAKILYCPSDNIHNAAATNFSYQDLISQTPVATGSTFASAEGTTKISYFVNGDATEANPQDLMTGDGNIGSAGTSASGAATWRMQVANATTTTATADADLELLPAAFSGPGYWSWTANDLHQKSGNLGMADGSCQNATISGLHTYLANSTNSSSGGLDAYNFLP
jgi:hypothetical protein